MRVLLVWPRFPKSFWSFEAVMALAGKKVLVTPLGLATVAGLLPQDWDMRLVDKNMRDLTEEDWAFADVVMLSAMIAQQDDYKATIREASARGIPVVVGGPYATSLPEDAEAAGADHIVQDEGEITIPHFLKAFTADPGWRRGEGEGARRYTANGAKPEMAITAMPRFELIELGGYDMVAVQYSRGCPFLCEFCDIINLYGRVPRTKPIDMMLAELQSLYDIGWRGGVFLVDDNFIGNKRNVKSLLRELRDWHLARGNPFYFQTEASIDLAADEDMLDLMIEGNFDAVFLGIETPDVDSLELTRKHQNNRGSMAESVRLITSKGIRVMAGFIIGFDNEKPGAGDRIVQFIEQCNITHAILAMLQVLPNTGLYTRLEKEGRLETELGTVNQTTAMNFMPTRPKAEIVREYVDALSDLYDPVNYMNRVYRHCLEVGLEKPAVPEPAKIVEPGPQIPQSDIGKWEIRKAIAKAFFNQTIRRRSRKVFWTNCARMLWNRPSMFGHFLVICAHNEHFIELTDITRSVMEAQIFDLSDEVYVPVQDPAAKTRKRPPALVSHFA